MSEQSRRLYRLGRSELLRQLKPKTLDALAEHSLVGRIEDKEYLVREGEYLDGFYAVTFGTIERVSNGRSKLYEINGTDAPVLVGLEELLISQRDSSSSIQSVSEYSKYLRIDRQKFGQLLDPQSKIDFLRILAQRGIQARQDQRSDQLIKSSIEQSLTRLGGHLDLLDRLSEYDQRESQQIEFRFLAKLGNDFRGKNPYEMKQAYVALSETDELRVRFDGKSYTVTGKKEYEGVRRNIISLPLDPGLFETLFNSTQLQILKKRYEVSFQGSDWRVDVFDSGSGLAGLVIAETDVEVGKECPPAPPGVNLVNNITGDKRFRNRRLATDGLPDS